MFFLGWIHFVYNGWLPHPPTQLCPHPLDTGLPDSTEVRRFQGFGLPHDDAAFIRACLNVG